MDWTLDPADFEWDGSLSSIQIENTDSKDWDLFVRLIRSERWDYSFSIGAESLELPIESKLLFRLGETTTPLLTIDPAGMKLNCHIYQVHDIELDFDVRDFDTEGKIDALSGFVVEIARFIGKPVAVSSEGDHEHPIWMFRPDSKCWLYRPVAEDISFR